MKKIKVSGVVTAAVLLFLGVFFVANLKLAMGPAKKFVKKETVILRGFFFAIFVQFFFQFGK